ncbi:MAG TPA: response regulator transcription factor [Candidatus Koribacter sp.]|jgi:two-component system KDP operon response regulator KdpE
MADAQRNILVVDDEAQITRVLRTTLSGQGFAVRTAGDGDEGLEVMREWTPDLVITDLSMPNMSGLELCRRIRSKSAVPIIVLSVRGEEKVKVEALDAGADDYVTKPFSMNELLARVRAGIRRSGIVAGQEPGASTIDVGDFHIELDSRMVFVSKREVRLTPKEFEVLRYLAMHPNKVITHRALLAAVWGGNSVEQPEYLRVFVNHLRKKFEVEGGPKYITTEPWVGYRFEPGE